MQKTIGKDLKWTITNVSVTIQNQHFVTKVLGLFLEFLDQNGKYRNTEIYKKSVCFFKLQCFFTKQGFHKRSDPWTYNVLQVFNKVTKYLKHSISNKLN